MIIIIIIIIIPTGVCSIFLKTSSNPKITFPKQTFLPSKYEFGAIVIVVVIVVVMVIIIHSNYHLML